MVVVTLVYVYILDILFCMDVSVSILIEKYCIKASFFFFFFTWRLLNVAAQANVPLVSLSSWPGSLVAWITAPMKGGAVLWFACTEAPRGQGPGLLCPPLCPGAVFLHTPQGCKKLLLNEWMRWFLKGTTLDLSVISVHFFTLFH